MHSNTHSNIQYLQVAHAELADVNIAFQPHVTDNEEDFSDDASVSSASHKDHCHIGQFSVINLNLTSASHKDHCHIGQFSVINLNLTSASHKDHCHIGQFSAINVHLYLNFTLTLPSLHFTLTCSHMFPARCLVVMIGCFLT